MIIFGQMCEPFHTFAQNIDWWYMLESVNQNLSIVLTKNWSSGFPTRSYINWAGESLKMARDLIFQI